MTCVATAEGAAGAWGAAPAACSGDPCRPVALQVVQRMARKIVVRRGRAQSLDEIHYERDQVVRICRRRRRDGCQHAAPHFLASPFLLNAHAARARPPACIQHLLRRLNRHQRESSWHSRGCRRFQGGRCCRLAAQVEVGAHLVGGPQGDVAHAGQMGADAHAFCVALHIDNGCVADGADLRQRRVLALGCHSGRSCPGEALQHADVAEEDVAVAVHDSARGADGFKGDRHGLLLSICQWLAVVLMTWPARCSSEHWGVLEFTGCRNRKALAAYREGFGGGEVSGQRPCAVLMPRGSAGGRFVPGAAVQLAACGFLADPLKDAASAKRSECPGVVLGAHKAFALVLVVAECELSRRFAGI